MKSASGAISICGASSTKSLEAFRCLEVVPGLLVHTRLLELSEAEQVLRPLLLFLRQVEGLFLQFPRPLFQGHVLAAFEQGLQFKDPGTEHILVLRARFDDLTKDERCRLVAAGIEEDFSLLEQNRDGLLAFRIHPDVVLVGREQGVHIDALFCTQRLQALNSLRGRLVPIPGKGLHVGDLLVLACRLFQPSGFVEALGEEKTRFVRLFPFREVSEHLPVQGDRLLVFLRIFGFPGEFMMGDEFLVQGLPEDIVHLLRRSRSWFAWSQAVPLPYRSIIDA